MNCRSHDLHIAFYSDNDFVSDVYKLFVVYIPNTAL